MGLINKINNRLSIRKEYVEAAAIFNKFSDFTMIPSGIYMENILLAKQAKNIQGAIVECGVWRGGMSAGIASVLGTDRDYYLYDSYEGLPDAGKHDGQDAIDYQKNTDSENYFDNCTAEISFAQEAMKKAGVSNAKFIKGWFKDTVPHHTPSEKIALLRLDGDWYDSTMECLLHLYDHIVEGGLIILDDYYTWDGCTRAVHDFLSKRNLPSRIRQYNNQICYIIKQSPND
jgi:O-methyltransferase